VLALMLRLEYVRLPWEHGSTAEKSSSAMEYAFPCLWPGKLGKESAFAALVGYRHIYGELSCRTDHEFVEINKCIEGGDDASGTSKNPSLQVKILYRLRILTSEDEFCPGLISRFDFFRRVCHLTLKLPRTAAEKGKRHTQMTLMYACSAPCLAWKAV